MREEGERRGNSESIKYRRPATTVRYSSWCLVVLVRFDVSPWRIILYCIVHYVHIFCTVPRDILSNGFAMYSNIQYSLMCTQVLRNSLHVHYSGPCASSARLHEIISNKTVVHVQHLYIQ